MRSVTFALLASFTAGCVTVPQGDAELLKPAIESFHQKLRWKDFRSAAERIVPERRDAFLKARDVLKDERDLFVTNFELDEAKLSPDTLTAKAFSKLSWYRLPSTTEETKSIVSIFVWRDASWLLESQSGGPFEELEPAPPPKPAPAP